MSTAVETDASGKAGAHTCDICNRSYSRLENLTRHKRASHTNESRHCCATCRKRFSRVDLLKKHEKTHAVRSVTSSRDISEPTRGDEHVGPVNTAGLPGAQLDARDSNAVAHGTIPDFALPELTADRVDALTHFDQDYMFGHGALDFDLAWTFDFMDQQDMILDDGYFAGCNDKLTAQDDDTPSSWPDVLSPSVSRTHHPHRQHPQQPGYVDEVELVDIVTLGLMNRPHQLRITPAIRDTLLEFMANSESGAPGEQAIVADQFPTPRVLQYFLDLYLIYIQSRFPIVHVSTFIPDRTSSELLMAMLLAGSCHAISNKSRFCGAYLEHVRYLLTLERERDIRNLDDFDHIFALTLLTLTATWSGRSEMYRRVEADRGTLVFACRSSRLLDNRYKAPSADTVALIPDRDRAWRQWIHAERRKRLGLMIYLIDCQFAALLQRQPYISKAETTHIALPCDSKYWEASSSRTWRLMLGPAEVPPSIYHLPVLSSILLEGESDDLVSLPPIDSFSRTLYLYILHGYIFEWRQKVSMLNTTGLSESPLALVPNHMGYGLTDQRRWVLQATGTWLNNYGPSGTLGDSAAPDGATNMLLYHLGRLALSINFSDLYALAGRSELAQDVRLATESVCVRLAADQACIDHAYQMLEVAFKVQSDGLSSQCTFEIVVCLFVGGMILWATDHLSQRPALSETRARLEQHYAIADAANADLRSLPQMGGGPATLKSRVRHIVAVLRSVRSVGFAFVFASVLDKLCESP